MAPGDEGSMCTILAAGVIFISPLSVFIVIKLLGKHLALFRWWLVYLILYNYAHWEISTGLDWTIALNYKSAEKWWVICSKSTDKTEQRPLSVSYPVQSHYSVHACAVLPLHASVLVLLMTLVLHRSCPSYWDYSLERLILLKPLPHPFTYPLPPPRTCTHSEITSSASRKQPPTTPSLLTRNYSRVSHSCY